MFIADLQFCLNTYVIQVDDCNSYLRFLTQNNVVSFKSSDTSLYSKNSQR